MNNNKKKSASFFGVVILVALLPIVIPLLICIGIFQLISTVLIYVAVWLFWNTRGIHVLYVYSNSPHWKDRIENEILPKLPEKKIVLNWSQRSSWRISLATMVFHHFGTYREYNPMGIVFRPFRKAKLFRFYEPLVDFKHGKEEPLKKIENDFFHALK